MAEHLTVPLTTQETPDIPDTLYRGERVYIHEMHELGKRALNTVGFEKTHNQDGKLYLSRDEAYATNYAIGTDGVKFYDNILPSESIPVGVTYEVHNPANVLGAEPQGDAADSYFPGHPLHGLHREFTVNNVPPDNYKVKDIHLMDDFDIQHVRSDARNIKETIHVDDHKDLDTAIAAARTRFEELELIRQQKIASGEYLK